MCRQIEMGLRCFSCEGHLSEDSYGTTRPDTDFWRVGPGYAKKLAQYGMYTMGDVARCSTGTSSDFYNEDLLYKLFGVNAELLIDHAWGWEPCTIEAIKAYRPESSSLGIRSGAAIPIHL